MNQDSNPQFDLSKPINAQRQHGLSDGGDDALQWKQIVDIMMLNKLKIALCTLFFLFAACVYLWHTPKKYTSTTTFLVKDEQAGGGVGGVAGELGDMGLFNTKSSVDNELEAFKSPYLMYMVVRELNLDVACQHKRFLRTDDLYKASPVAVSLPQKRDDEVFTFDVKIKDRNTFELSNFEWYDAEAADMMEADTAIVAHAADTVSTPVGLVSVAIDPINATGEDVDLDGYVVTVVKTDAYKTAMEYIKNLTVELASKKASVINVAYTDISPEKATDVLNSLLSIYNRDRLDDKRQTATNTSKFIDGRLMIIEQELGGIDNDIEQYKSRQLLTNVHAEGNSFIAESNEYGSRSLQINNQLEIARYIKSILATPEEQPTMLPANAGLSDGGIRGQIEEYNALVMKHDRLMSNSSDKNPLVVELRAQMANMRVSIDRTLDNLVKTYEMQLKSLKNKEGEIKRQIAHNPKQEKYLVSIGRQQKIKESLYLYLLQKREENELSGNMLMNNLRMITPPRAMDKPVSPKKLQILALATIFGFALAVGILWLMEVLNTTVRNKKDLNVLSIPHLGETPLCGEIKERMDGPLPVKIVVKDRSRDFVNESFRVLRTNLSFMTQGMQSRVLMFTSYFPNSGKTFVASNLANSVALGGKKVILVDLDMRKAELSKHLANKHHGVTNYLSGQEEVLKKLIVRSSLHENLDILPCGSMPPNPAELLLSDRLPMLFDELKKDYEYVFVDCTPLNIVADASLVGKQVDMVLFVIREGKFERDALPDLEALYQSKSFKRMATILNGTQGKAGYGYGGKGRSYGYGYGYGYYGSDEKTY